MDKIVKFTPMSGLSAVLKHWKGDGTEATSGPTVPILGIAVVERDIDVEGDDEEDTEIMLEWIVLWGLHPTRLVELIRDEGCGLADVLGIEHGT